MDCPNKILPVNAGNSSCIALWIICPNPGRFRIRPLAKILHQIEPMEAGIVAHYLFLGRACNHCADIKIGYGNQFRSANIRGAEGRATK